MKEVLYRNCRAPDLGIPGFSRKKPVKKEGAGGYPAANGEEAGGLLFGVAPVGAIFLIRIFRPVSL